MDHSYENRNGQPAQRFVYQHTYRKPQALEKVVLTTWYRPKAAQQKLGEGSQGEVFELPDGRAMKLTWDASEANAAFIVQKSPDPNGNVYHVFDVLRLPLNDENVVKDMFVIVTELLTKMPESDHFWPKLAFWSGNGAVSPENVQNYFVENNLRIDDQDSKDFHKWIHDVAEYLSDLGIVYKDLYEKNVMMRGDQHVVIDLGYSKSPKQDIDTIARMLKVATLIASLRY